MPVARAKHCFLKASEWLLGCLTHEIPSLDIGHPNNSRINQGNGNSSKIYAKFK
jgi:hypothetical protein